MQAKLRKKIRAGSVPLSLALLLALATTGAMAADRVSPDKPQIKVEIRVIVASNSGRGTDDGIRDLIPEISRLGFTRSELFDRMNVYMTLGTRSAVQVPVKRWLNVEATSITPRADKKDEIRLVLQVEQPPRFETTLTIVDGGTLLLGGPTYEDANILLAVTASTVK